jgi:hypothetical protein
MLALHLGLLFVIDFADLSLGMVLLHLFTFDPEWLSPLSLGESWSRTVRAQQAVVQTSFAPRRSE